MANRLHGCSAHKAASATECRECQRCVAGVSHRQDSLEDRPDQDSAVAPGGCQGQAVWRDGSSTSVPQIVLSFFIEKREQLFDKAGLSGEIRQALRDLLADDAVVMAQGLEPVWRRAAQDWHIGCSFGVKGNEGRTMLWSGMRNGDTMADLIFCLAFLRLQMTLEEMLT